MTRFEFLCGMFPGAYREDMPEWEFGVYQRESLIRYLLHPNLDPESRKEIEDQLKNIQSLSEAKRTPQFKGKR